MSLQDTCQLNGKIVVFKVENCNHSGVMMVVVQPTLLRLYCKRSTFYDLIPVGGSMDML